MKNKYGPAVSREVVLEPTDINTVAVFESSTSNIKTVLSNNSHQTADTTKSFSKYKITGITAGVAIGLIVIISIGYYCKKCQNQRQYITVGIRKRTLDRIIHLKNTQNNVELQQDVHKCLMSRHEFPRHRLNFLNELGKGNFGVVHKALARDIGEERKDMIVAVKMLNENATASQREEMLREINILQEIGRHQNILGIIGCCTNNEPYLLITEYMKHGDLLTFLWRSKETQCQEADPIYNLSVKSYYQIARQIARGMEFLAHNKVVHGDLAARNILVGEGLQVKISDFGLANDVYLQGWTALPTSRLRAAKWVSLETNLNGLCTIQSDVWSYGIVLHEIATRGCTPYEGMSAVEVVTAIKEGYRMPQAEECPNAIFQ
ncbi:tyrosine-protein kinase transmembrane receptor Ror-like [Glandiceps talaboti]